MPLASDDQGAVTAELMLLMPVVALGVGLLGTVFGVATERMSLERATAAGLREIAIGREWTGPPGTSSRTWVEGRLLCLELEKSDLFSISAKHCALPLS